MKETWLGGADGPKAPFADGNGMRILSSYKGKEQRHSVSDNVVVGRPKTGFRPELDLSPDLRVSRPHARIWVETGQYWIEDLDSSAGTKVNGEEIKGKGKRRLHASDVILAGETTLRVEIPREEDRTVLARKTPAPERPSTRLETSLDATRPAFLRDHTAAKELQREAFLYELPLQFASVSSLDALLQLVTQRIVEALPGAERGALLLGQGLLLQACHPANFRPSVTLARKALEQRQAFIWPDPAEMQEGRGSGKFSSAGLRNVKSTMYAPLLWQGETLGVICVDNSRKTDAFRPEDLRLMLAFAHHGAMAIATFQLQDELRHNAQVMERLLTNFSPKIRRKLLHEAQQGRFRPGGKKSEVTVLSSDLRQFTALTAPMDTDDIVKMLNEYFAVLVECVFKYEGTIDKFIGDAILAVFGSPDPVEEAEAKAVRAALAMQEAVAALNRRRKALGLVACEIGIGIHCGEVLHGFIGTAERMEFTIVGDAVNRVSRYCDGARDGRILISPEMRARVWHLFSLEDITFEDKHGNPMTAYRVLPPDSGSARPVTKPPAA